MPASAEARIVRTMIELGAFIERTAMYCPRDIKHLMCTNLETMQQPDGERPRAPDSPLQAAACAGCLCWLLLGTAIVQMHLLGLRRQPPMLQPQHPMCS